MANEGEQDDFRLKFNDAIKAVVTENAPEWRKQIDMGIMMDLVSRGHAEMVKGQSTEERMRMDEATNRMMQYRSPHIELLPHKFRSPRCAYCYQEKALDKLDKCGRCLKVYYCNKECQRNAWPIHKQKCVSPM